MKVINAPNKYDYIKDTDISIFLAGSIEMGKAIDWQARVEQKLSRHDNVTLLNPRRDDWDPTWEQATSNHHFVEQVYWELDNLAEASYIFMNFDPNTISPVSLLELGAYATEENMLVCCPRNYFRSGNVEIFCKRNRIQLVDTFDEALDTLDQTVVRHTDKEGDKP